eukprot:Tbor_TRINITY_DN647_c0_g1::TRINITY_DN647_c0_g1_i1::g.1596::m.1596
MIEPSISPDVEISGPSKFHQLVLSRSSGIVTYGITPPKAVTEKEKLSAVGVTQSDRLNSIDIDAIILYDIHDEAERKTAKARPFPFCDTLDGVDFAEKYLIPNGVVVPFIFYRCIAKYNSIDALKDYLTNITSRVPLLSTVFVGGACSNQELSFTLNDAYNERKALSPDMVVGAVCIPERHASKGNEHERMVAKMEEGGAKYFVTQCVYNVDEMRNVISDYSSLCKEKGLQPVPILVTLTPCGSLKTLEFLEWLGVKVSKWLENDLRNPCAEGILEESCHALVSTFRELVYYAKRKGVPLGVNVESVAIRKAEIDASLNLVKICRNIMEEAALTALTPVLATPTKIPPSP